MNHSYVLMFTRQKAKTFLRNLCVEIIIICLMDLLFSWWLGLLLVLYFSILPLIERSFWEKKIKWAAIMSFDFRLTLRSKIINVINFYLATFAAHTEYRFTILDSPLNIHTSHIIFTRKTNQIDKKTFSTILFEPIHFDLPIDQRYRKYAKLLVVGGTEGINRFKIFQIFLF